MRYPWWLIVLSFVAAFGLGCVISLTLAHMKPHVMYLHDITRAR